MDRAAEGILAIDIAINAPMMEVLGVIPIRAIICMHITAAKKVTQRLTINVSFSIALTC